MVIIPNGLGIVRSKNTKDSKNDMKLEYRLYSKVRYNL